MWTGEMLQAVGHSFGDDGLFWLSYEELLKHFPALNRVRLFDEVRQVNPVMIELY